MSAFASATSAVAQWRSVRRLYPIYSALAEKFSLGTPPFADLDQFGSDVETAAIPRIQNWLAEMDQRIQPHQFRQMLQSTGLANAEEKLAALVRRHLDKATRGDADRDKLDFLLTQYVAVCAPPSFQTRELSLEDVAQVLEPVLGECPAYVPQWLEPLEALVEQMRECTNLEQFDSLNIFQRGRDLKLSAGEKFFTSTSLLAFTRFNYLARCTFAKLLAIDVQEIENLLRQLQEQGATQVDASEAGFAPETPIESVREVLRALMSSAGPDYSADTPSKQLQIRLLRQAVEEAAERYKTALSEADQVRFARLELEVEELRSDVDRLRQECEELRAALTAQQQEHVAAVAMEVPIVVEPPESPAPAPTFAVSPAPAPPEPPAVATPDVPPAADIAADAAQDSSQTSTQINELLDRIRKSLRAAGPRPSGVITLGTGTVLLSEDEIAVLQSSAEATDAVAGAIERAIGTRALLVQKCEARKAGQDIELKPLMKLATDVFHELQRLGGTPNARQATITASARQLWNVMQHAEKSQPAAARRA